MIGWSKSLEFQRLRESGLAGFSEKMCLSLDLGYILFARGLGFELWDYFLNQEVVVWKKRDRLSDSMGVRLR
jgi:hypothetical protein